MRSQAAAAAAADMIGFLTTAIFTATTVDFWLHLPPCKVPLHFGACTMQEKGWDRGKVGHGLEIN
jgi:hypothetical protein